MVCIASLDDLKPQSIDGPGMTNKKNLKKGAVDVRSRDMTSSEKEAFKKAAKDVADSVILETIPPHFHLQL